MINFNDIDPLEYENISSALLSFELYTLQLVYAFVLSSTFMKKLSVAIVPLHAGALSHKLSTGKYLGGVRLPGT